MDDDTRRRLLGAVIDEDEPGRGRARRWTVLETAERAGLVLSHARRGLHELREHDPPLVWGDIDADTGEELWCLLSRRSAPSSRGPGGLNELDRLEAGEPASWSIRGAPALARDVAQPRGRPARAFAHRW